MADPGKSGKAAWCARAIAAAVLTGSLPGSAVLAQSGPETAHALVVAGRASLESNDLVAAESLLVRAAELYPDSASIYTALAELYTRRDADTERAEQAINRAIRLEPANIRLLEQQLEILIDKRGLTFRGDAKLMSAARTILDSDSTSAVAHHAAALVYERRYRQQADMLARRPNRVLARQTERNLDRTLRHFMASLESDPRRLDLYDSVLKFAVETQRFDTFGEVARLMRLQLPGERTTLLYSGIAALYENESDAAASYFEQALGTMSDAALADYLRLDLILNPDQKKLAAEDSTAFWSTYWEQRRPRYLSEANERILAHYERIVLADLLFPYWRDYPNDGWIITPANILIRYGHPNYRGSWLAGDDRTRQMVMSYPHYSYIFDDWTRNGEYLIESMLIDGESRGSVVAVRAIIEELPEVHSVPRTIRDIDIAFQHAQFRNVDDRRTTELFIASGVPVTPADSAGSIENVTARTGAFVVDSDGTVVGDRRQTYYGMTHDGFVYTPEGQLWCSARTMTLSPDAQDVSIEVDLPGHLAYGMSRQTIAHRSFDTSEVAVSDLLVAYLVSDEPTGGNPCAIRRRGLEILPAPVNHFYRVSPLYTYFEVYNLSRDATARTRFSVEVAVTEQTDEPGLLRRAWDQIIGRARDAGVSIRTEVSGTDPDTGEYVIVDLADLHPGDYLLSVRIVDLNTGESSVADREIRLE